MSKFRALRVGKGLGIAMCQSTTSAVQTGRSWTDSPRTESTRQRMHATEMIKTLSTEPNRQKTESCGVGLWKPPSTAVKLPLTVNARN